MATEPLGFTVETRLSFEEADSAIREYLKAEGFGILTEIDVRATLADKLGAEFRPYKILGACNPHLAHRALGTAPEVGLLLPCNVVVEATDGGSRVSILNPEQALGVLGDERLVPIAREAAERLRRVAAAYEAGAHSRR